MSKAIHHIESKLNTSNGNNGTTDSVIQGWAASPAPTCRAQYGNVSQLGKQLYSYELLIGEVFRSENTNVALVLPHHSSAATTNRHINSAQFYANRSLLIHDVFMVPDIDPRSAHNANYLCDLVNTYRNTVLNTGDKRRQYKTRVNAATLYYDALIDLYEYGRFAYMYDDVKMPEPYVEKLSLFDMLEQNNDYKFLGKLALEGDADRIITGEKEYLELTGRH